MKHSSVIFLILLFTKPNIEVSGWLYQIKTHFTHIVYQPFSRVSPPSFTLYDPSLESEREVELVTLILYIFFFKTVRSYVKDKRVMSLTDHTSHFTSPIEYRQ